MFSPVTKPLAWYNGTRSTFDLDQINNAWAVGILPCTIGTGTVASSTRKSGQFKIDSFDKTNYRLDKVIAGTFQFETDRVVIQINCSNLAVIN